MATLLVFIPLRRNRKNADCIEKVNLLWKEYKQKGQEIDEKMAQSVSLAQRALEQQESLGFDLLKQALHLGLECFKEWNLVSPALNKHMDELMSFGAQAVKPTGSGNGGFIISLWKSPPKLDHLCLFNP